MRIWLPLTTVVALSACGASVPDSGAGVGFGDYTSYEAQQRRDAALSTGRRPQSELAQAPANGGTGAPTAAEINQALGRSPAQAAAPSSNTQGAAISDEQSFAAVSSRETISSDARRIEQQRAQYQQVPVTQLPERPEDLGPNLARYALSTSNQPGEKIYRRSGLTGQKRYERACGAFISAAAAQEAFLAAGGPDRDRKGLDPDGDGFACAWDPRPFRAARG